MPDIEKLAFHIMIQMTLEKDSYFLRQVRARKSAMEYKNRKKKSKKRRPKNPNQDTHPKSQQYGENNYQSRILCSEFVL